jgi:PKD repeat protein
MKSTYNSNRRIIVISVVLVCLAVQAGYAALPTIGALPLPDLGTGTWGGYPGGLYPNSTNQRPSAIETAAIDIATNQMQPLDADGNPDPVNGKIVLISIVMSNTGQEFTKFISIANTDPSLNPKLVIVNGAIGGMDAVQWTDPEDPDTWPVLYGRLANVGVTRYQVQAVWVKQAKMNPAAEGAFPVHAQKLQGYIETIARNIKTNLPNAKIAYYSSRTRAFVLEGLNPEPYAYESSFSVKWMIQNQINGTGNLNWDPAHGTVVAPLILWGPYLWADGENPRSDGFTWLESDTQADGTHPSATGTEKVGRQLKAFFKTDPTARPWFLNHQYTGQPPTVSIITDKIAGAPGMSVDFIADASDPDGSIIEYEWTYDDSLFSTDANPTKSFPVEGVYNVRLTVTDNQGNASTATKLITVSSDNPVASFTTDVDLGLAPLTVNFDGSSSTDGNAPIVSYDWDFGDGNTASGITTNHTYTVNGDYNAVLTVTAQNLLTGVAEKNIHVGPLDVNEMGDLYADGRIDLLDYTVLADYWLTGELTVDIVSDGIIDYKDLSAMTDHWMVGVPIPNQDPVAYYMFNGNVEDSSGFDRDGIIFGNPTWAAGFDGTPNGALDFDGV